ncbi:DUF3150 domain-containing protein [Pseudomonas qingdaonensis]|uniref:DUF3150 domain-containing protein n=1 Tax=Pseudomonas TaxID=286 RepID=UPI002119949B|nr:MULTISPECIES: DUF3150 domain-containing protein [Pseudomonas]UXH55980.1 DUF3150 domain-containing protein [Pseudomonas aeruginosa]UXH69025.1 DUF3150 domain-containing protein [Pseudomonas aeruginosa]WKL67240.1 DUF3150 domain-containing protein [Pseudomonas qingdaonensis]
MTIQQNEIKILDQILLVDLSGIHLWTARKKLKPEMLEGKIPPAKLASLGSMRVIDPEKLKPFEKIKRRATSVLENYGIKFLGGYAIPQEKIRDVVDELEALKNQFYDLKNNFIPNYDRWVTEWIEKDWERPEWREAIARSVTPKAQVDQGIQFGYAACRVAPDGDKHLSQTLGSQVRGLSDQLYAETAETAERLMDTGLATRGHVTQTTLNTVRKMNTKLKGLMFLSGDVKALADYIDELLASLPKSGVVNGSQYNQVVTLVSTLSEEDSIRRLIKNLSKANGAEAPEAEVEEQAQEEVIHVQQPAEPEAPEPVVETVVEEIPLDAQTVDEEELASMAVPADPFAVVNEVPTALEQPEPEPAAAVLEELVIPQPTPVSSVVAHGVFSF